jgi:hypothetical protein
MERQYIEKCKAGSLQWVVQTVEALSYSHNNLVPHTHLLLMKQKDSLTANVK